MKSKYLLFGLLGLASCSQDQLLDFGLEGGTKEGVVMTGEDYLFTPATRSGFEMNGSRASFTWRAGDVVGVFPKSETPDQTIVNEGDQVPFPISDNVNGAKATFNGGGWALRPAYSYVAYFPLKEQWGVDKKKLPVSYVGQKFTGIGKQNGNDFIDFSGYDFMTAYSQTANSEGFLNFAFKHVGAMVIVNLKMEAPGTLKSFALETSGSDEQLFTQEGFIDLTAPVRKDDKGNVVAHEIHPTKRSNCFKVDVENVKTTAENLNTTLYFQMPPTETQNRIVRFVYTYLTEDGQEKTVRDNCIEFKDRNVQAGNGYSLSISGGAWDKFQITAGSLQETIQDLSLYSALRLGGTLNGTDIRFLRSVLTDDQSILKTLDLEGCKIVEGGEAYDGVHTTENDLIGDGMFSGCKNLKELVLPARHEGAKVRIGKKVLEGCERLATLRVLSEDNVTDIDAEAFQGFTNSKNCTLYIEESLGANLERDAEENYAFRGASWADALTRTGTPFIATEPATHTITQLVPGLITTSLIKEAAGSSKKLVIGSNLNTWDLKAISKAAGTIGSTEEPIIDDLEFFYGVYLYAKPGFVYHSYVNEKGQTVNLTETENDVIPERMFENSKLRRVVMPNQVLTLKERAFMGSSLLTEFQFPFGLHDIGKSAFEGTGFSTVNIVNPGTNYTIGERAFAHCPNLQSMNLPKAKSYASEFISGTPLLTKLKLYDGTILPYAFKGSSLQELTLGKNIFRIEANAFVGMSDLVKLTMTGTYRDSYHSDMFADVNNTRQISLLLHKDWMGDKDSRKPKRYVRNGNRNTFLWLNKVWKSIHWLDSDGITEIDLTPEKFEGDFENPGEDTQNGGSIMSIKRK